VWLDTSCTTEKKQVSSKKKKTKPEARKWNSVAEKGQVRVHVALAELRRVLGRFVFSWTVAATPDININGTGSEGIL
jgi:hypothetical protein